METEGVVASTLEAHRFFARREISSGKFPHQVVRELTQHGLSTRAAQELVEAVLKEMGRVPERDRTPQIMRILLGIFVVILGGLVLGLAYLGELSRGVFLVGGALVVIGVLTAILSLFIKGGGAEDRPWMSTLPSQRRR